MNSSIFMPLTSMGRGTRASGLFASGLLIRAAVLTVLQTAALQTQAAETTPPQQLPKVSVGAETEEESESYKPDIPSSPKYTEVLRDTPQTITIIPQQVIKDQRLLSMRDILSIVPGITFGAGEGGGGYGDSITIRGFTGSSDIMIDGVRDSAQYTRSDPFNLEQVEVVNGASSVYSGAGSVGGSVNIVTKQAHAGDALILDAGVGTDEYARFTSDMNQQFNDSMALRVNLMAHRNDVAGRDYEHFERWGVAPSLTFGLDSDTSATFNYIHQSDDNTPQYGVPFFNGRPLPGVDSSSYFGYRNIDEQQIDTDSLTAIVNHRFNERLSLRNLTRAQRIDQLSIVDATQGTWCMPNNQTPTGGSCTTGIGAAAITVPAGFYMPSGPRGLVRDTTNELIYNQLDLTGSFATGSVEHTLVVGFSISHETFGLDTSNDFRNPDGTNPFAAPAHLPFMDIFDPDSRYAGPVNRTLTGKTDSELDNAAVYAFDTLKLSERWQLNAGVRYERNDGSTKSYTVQGTATNGGLPPPGSPAIGTITGSTTADNKDNLFSYRAGLIFKPEESGTIYFAYGNSKTPSKPSVNASCNLTPTTNTGANCNVDPETAISYELGVKWDLFGDWLAVNAAIFRNDRQNYRVNDPDPANVTGEQVLDGRARVDGFILGAGGNILRQWALSANYTYLDSEVLQGISDFARTQGPDYIKGDPLLQVPKHAFSLWTVYETLWGLQFGYGATYQDELYLTQHSASNVNGPLVTASGYVTHRAMAGYTFNDKLAVQLNVNNLFDKEYYTRIRNNGWATPGEGRSAILSASYSF